jgi:hypothetical protein
VVSAVRCDFTGAFAVLTYAFTHCGLLVRGVFVDGMSIRAAAQAHIVRITVLITYCEIHSTRGVASHPLDSLGAPTRPTEGPDQWQRPRLITGGALLQNIGFVLARPLSAFGHDALQEMCPRFACAAHCLLPLSGDIVRAVDCLHFVCSLCICHSFYLCILYTVPCRRTS